MRRILFLFIALFAVSIALLGQQKTVHDFTVTDINGESFDMAQLAGKKILIVNTASKCGFTPQYEGLEKLYQTYKDDNFVVVAFPSNDFKNQEPGSNEEIKQFCKRNYGVSFPLMSKISVKKGEDQHPLYQWLTHKSKNGVMDSKVNWNFQKYMIDEQGKLVDYAKSRTKPLSDKIVNWVEADKDCMQKK